MTKFTPLSTYVFNVFVSNCGVFFLGWVAWSICDVAEQGKAAAAIVNVFALVLWGGKLGELYFEVFHGPLDRVAEKRFRLRQRRARRRAEPLGVKVR